MESKLFKADSEIFEFTKSRLTVAAVCDMLDGLGLRQQAMHQRLRPLLSDPKNCGFVGRARTLRWMEMDYIVEEDPYGSEIEAMDSLKPGDVVVHSTDYSGNISPWGELMSTVACKRRAVGCVCDANIRDCARIIQMGFPVYYAGIRPLDSKGRARVVAFDVPVRCGEVLVRPGEIIFADFDGIVVVPRNVESQVFELAMEKVSKENRAREDLQRGISLRDTYLRHQVL